MTIMMLCPTKSQKNSETLSTSKRKNINEAKK